MLALVLRSLLPLAPAAGDASLLLIDRWPTRGGSPARTGVAAAHAVLGPVEIAWKHDAEGKIEGEPLVWDNRVILCTVQPNGIRQIRVLDLSTGAKSYQQNVRSQRPLSPSLWGKLIAYREDNALAVARIGATRLTPVMQCPVGSRVGAPLLVEEDLYVATDLGLRHFDTSTRKETWSVPGAFRGEIAALDASLYAVSVDSGMLRLNCISAGNGGARWSEIIGDGVPEDADENYGLAVDPLRAYVYSPSKLTGYTTPSEVHFTGLLLTTHDPLEFGAGLLGFPTPFESGFLGVIQDQASNPVFVLVDDPGTHKYHPLAGSTRAPELLAPLVAPTLTEGVCYFGSIAFSVSTGRVLWNSSVKPSQRPVVAGGMVLYVVGERSLCAVRSRARRSVEAMRAVEGSPALRGRLVLSDGSIEEGDFTLDGTTRSVTRDAKPQPRKWLENEYLLLEDESGKIAAAGDVDRALEILGESFSGKRYLALGRDARQTNDPALLADLIAKASRNGVEDKGLDDLRKLVDNWTAHPSARPKPDVVAALRKKMEEATAIPAELAWKRVELLPEELRAPLETRLLRTVLALDRSHAGALERVKLLLPEGLRPSGPLPSSATGEALLFVDAARSHPIEFVQRPVNPKDATFAQRQLEMRRPRFGQGLQGIRSENLLIVSRATRYGSLASVLSVGELTCSILQELVGAPAVGREERDPMVVEIYLTREDYLKSSARELHDPSADLAWTAGFYDSQDNVSRFYVPESERELPDFITIAAHELTHHWLSTRCSKWKFQITESSVRRPGFWITEGFANWVGEFGIDPAQGAWVTGVRASKDLDIVGSAGPHLIPWKKLINGSQLDYLSIDVKQVFPVDSNLYLGRQHPLTLMSCFYAQAAALTRWLYEAEDGAHRKQLLDYLTAYYSGDESGLDLEKTLGLDAATIGERVAAYSRKVLAGE